MLEAILVAGLVSAPKNPTAELLEPKPVVQTVQVKEPTLYTIKEGDTLTSISRAYSVDLSRLWAANPELTNPDIIEPSKSLKIPEADEVLSERPLPASVVTAPTLNQSASRRIDSVGSSVSTPGWYDANSCTGWVASKRYVPNGWGNATDWKWHAQQEGWTVSSTPVVGSIGWTSGHVVYVESVNNDGTITISEQNWDWHGSIRTITVKASKYVYLYQ